MVPALDPLPSSRHHMSIDDCLEDKRENIRTVLCCFVYGSCAQRYAQKYEQFLNTSIGLGLGLFLCLFELAFFCVFWFSLDYFVLALFAFVVLGFGSSVPAKRLAGKYVSAMTYFVSSGT